MPDRLIALDTNALSAWLRREADLFLILSGGEVALPAPVIAEATYGWSLAIRKAEQRDREDLAAHYLDRLADLQELSRELPILRYSAAAQALYRSFRATRGSRGRNDLRIAAICVAHDVPLLTRNLEDFRDIAGLKLETW